jgi:hypothetical protein
VTAILDAPAAPAPPPRQHTNTLHPAAVEAAVRYSKVMAEATIIPRRFRGQPANVFWAVSFADMVGLHPLAVMDQIWFNDDGQPAARATLIATLVRKAGHRLRVEGDAHAATAEIVRCDDPDTPRTITWDLDKAQRAGLIQGVDEHGRAVARDADGHPTPWQLYTEALLAARATTAAARLVCPEALYGLCYTPEELGALVDAEGNVIGRAAAPRSEQRPADPIEKWLTVIAKATTRQALDAAGRSIAGAKERGQIDEPGRARLDAAYRKRLQELGGGPPRAELPAAPADAAAQASTQQPQTQPEPPDEQDPDPDEHAAQQLDDEAAEQGDAGDWGEWDAPTDGDPFAGLSDADPMGGDDESGSLFLTRAAAANAAAAAPPHL